MSRIANWRSIAAFAAARKERAHAVIQIASPFLATYRMRLIELTAAERLMACETKLFVAEGYLMAYGPDFVEMSYRAAAFADKILKGAKPADLPVQQPTKFEFVHQPRDGKGAWADNPAVRTDSLV